KGCRAIWAKAFSSLESGYGHGAAGRGRGGFATGLYRAEAGFPFSYGRAFDGYYLPFERAGREVSGSKLRLAVKPVLTWKTRILSLRDVRANQALSYGGIYVTKAPSRIAVLPVGYADGLNRALSSRGRVIIREHYAPIVGRIS